MDKHRTPVNSSAEIFEQDSSFYSSTIKPFCFFTLVIPLAIPPLHFPSRTGYEPFSFFSFSLLPFSEKLPLSHNPVDTSFFRHRPGSPRVLCLRHNAPIMVVMNSFGCRPSEAIDVLETLSTKATRDREILNPELVEQMERLQMICRLEFLRTFNIRESHRQLLQAQVGRL